MASEQPNTYETPTSFYEFEGLEVTEFDVDALRELLEEPEENVQGNISDGIIRPTESTNGHPHSSAMEYSDKVQPHCDDFAWIDTMEIDPVLPSNDIHSWYIDAYTEEMISGTVEVRNVIEDSDNTVPIDELAYFGFGLRQGN